MVWSISPFTRRKPELSYLGIVGLSLPQFIVNITFSFFTYSHYHQFGCPVPLAKDQGSHNTDDMSFKLGSITVAAADSPSPSATPIAEVRLFPYNLLNCAQV